MIGRVSEAAMVETISFGTPTGSARIACAAIDVPPEPPSASTPSQRPSACRRRDDRRRALGHGDRPPAPRSPAARSAATSAPAARGDLVRADVGLRTAGRP